MKALFKNKFFTIFFALFMTFSALLGITATLPRSAKADDATSDIPDFSTYTAKEVEVGDVITGCWLKIWVEEWSTPEGGTNSFGWEYIEVRAEQTVPETNSLVLLVGHYKTFLARDDGSDYITYQKQYFNEEESAAYVYIDEVIHGDQQPDYVRDQTGWTFKEAVETLGIDVDFKIYVLEEGTAEPLPDEQEPEEPTAGEKLDEIGNNVSEWLGENLGIAVTGSTVLMVAGIIIVVMLLRRRRR